ncbi:MAG: hypothetical protein C0507_16315 [Cyanobacteria bacterium PR.3.49]|nr:hypothetical protein [Cyanobacteria bacterium PR.3.49]
MKLETEKKRMISKAAVSWFVGYASQFIIGSGLTFLICLVAMVAAPDASFHFLELLGAVFNYELAMRIAAAAVIALVASLTGTYKRAILTSVFLNQLIVAIFVIALGFDL